MCKKFCIRCRNVYDVEETKCPNCGLDPNKMKLPKCFDFPKVELKTISFLDMLNKEVEESPIYKATIDFEKWHAEEQKKLAECVSKEVAANVLRLAIQLSDSCRDVYEFQNRLVDLIETIYGIEVEIKTIIPAENTVEVKE